MLGLAKARTRNDDAAAIRKGIPNTNILFTWLG